MVDRFVLRIINGMCCSIAFNIFAFCEFFNSVSFVVSFGKCCQILAGDKLHDSFWQSCNEKVLEVLEMSVSYSIVMDSLAH